jgi:peptidoglycan hydrolase CwlO-like protein
MSTSLVTCEQHGDEVVVVYNNNHSRSMNCPLCEAEAKVQDLQNQLGDVTDERDDLQKQVDDWSDGLAESMRISS